MIFKICYSFQIYNINSLHFKQI